jgi:predicted alpha/beta hydrolase family esterase
LTHKVDTQQADSPDRPASGFDSRAVWAGLDDFRILVVPGLHNSVAGHWQSRWQLLAPRLERVQQDDWDHPQLDVWSARLDQLRALDRRPTLLVAHSFGCLTAVRSIHRDAAGVAGVLLVAPADPVKFDVVEQLPHGLLPCPSVVIASSNDPWMQQATAALWARRWGSEFVDAGALGHINADSGLGDWDDGQRRLQMLAQRARRTMAEVAHD